MTWFLSLLGALAITPLWGARYERLPRKDFPIPDASIEALLESHGTLYMGGTFTRLQQNSANPLASWDDASFAALPDRPDVNGEIQAVVSDPAGGCYVFGAFTQVGGFARLGAAHVFPDGSVDPDWAPRLEAVRIATARLAGNKVVVGGMLRTRFENGEQLYDSLLMLDAQTGHVIGKGISGNGAVEAIVSVGLTLYVSGGFTRLGETERAGLAAIDARTGQVLPWIAKPSPTPPSALRLVTADCQRLYLIAGTASSAGEPITTLVLLDPVSGGPVDWSPKALPRVFVSQIITWNGKIYLIGSGAELFGRGGVMVLDAVTGQRLPYQAGLPEGMPFDAVVGGRNFFVSGLFPDPESGHAPSVFAVDPATGRAERLVGDLRAPIMGLSYGGGRLHATATRSEGVIRRGGLAAVDLRTGKILPWAPRIFTGGVRCLSLFEDRLLIGGAFVLESGTGQTSLAAVDRITGAVLPWSPLGHQWPPPTIECMTILSNTVYVGGYFTNLAGQPRNHLAAVDFVTGELKAWNPNADERVASIAVVGRHILAGGYFRTMRGERRIGIASIDPETGELSDWPVPTLEFPPYQPYVKVIEVVTNTLYLGGVFTLVNQRSRSHAAAFDVESGRLLTWASISQPEITAMKYFDGRLYQGGCGIGGRARSSVGDLSPLSGQPNAWAPEFSRMAPGSLGECLPGQALAATPNYLCAAGLWERIDDRYQPHLAVFPREGAPRITQEPRGVNLASGGRLILQATSEGVGPLSHQWEFNGTPIPNALQPTLIIEGVTPGHSGVYQLVVTNEIGYVRSVPARATVFEPPSLVVQPRGQEFSPGETVQLTAVAAGSPTPAFQWRRNGVVVPGANQASLIISNAQPADGGLFELVGANAGGARTFPAIPVRARLPVFNWADDFSAAVALPGLSGSVMGDNAEATREAGEPLHDGKPGQRSVWARLHADVSGVLVVDTRGSGVDTLLGIYSGASLEQLRREASDDDAGGYFTSVTACPVVAGKTYYIAVDSVDGQEGFFVLTWSIESAITDFPRLLVAPADVAIHQGGTARFQAVATAAESLVYQWFFNDCSPIPGATNDTLVVANVSAEDVGRYAAVISSSKRSLTTPAAQLEVALQDRSASSDKFPAASAIAALPRIQRAEWAQGFTFQSAGMASVSAGVPGQQRLNTFRSTTDVGEPNHAGVLGGASRWLRLQPSLDGTLMVNTIGSQIDTVLAIYQGDRLSNLRLVGQDDNGAPDRVRSLVRVPVQALSDYLIAVDGVGGTQGSVVINWVLGTVPELRIPSLNVSGAVGQSTRIETSASGVPAPVIYWMRGGNVVYAGTNTALFLPSLQWEDTGYYIVSASNMLGTISGPPLLVRLNAEAPIRALLVAGRDNESWGLRVTGLTHPQVALESSTDLRAWIELFRTNASTDAPLLPINAPGSSDSTRFFRLSQP